MINALHPTSSVLINHKLRTLRKIFISVIIFQKEDLIVHQASNCHFLVLNKIQRRLYNVKLVKYVQGCMQVLMLEIQEYLRKVCCEFYSLSCLTEVHISCSTQGQRLLVLCLSQLPLSQSSKRLILIESIVFECIVFIVKIILRAC